MRRRRAIGSHPPDDQPFGYYKTGSRSSRIGLPSNSGRLRSRRVTLATQRETNGKMRAISPLTQWRRSTGGSAVISRWMCTHSLPELLFSSRLSTAPSGQVGNLQPFLKASSSLLLWKFPIRLGMNSCQLNSRHVEHPKLSKFPFWTWSSASLGNVWKIQCHSCFTLLLERRLPAH